MPKRPLTPPVCIPEKPGFREFSGEDFWHVPGYRRNLPHWRLKEATYFVTFRLADSLPETAVKQWKEETRFWLIQHEVDPDWQTQDRERFESALKRIPPSERQRFEREQNKRFFVELDKCHGCCPLKKPEAAQIVAQSLHFFHGQRLWLGDFVVMPNHVHVIAQMFEGISLENWLYSVKRYCATQLLKTESLQPLLQKRAGHVWQTESFDRIIRNRDELSRTRKYIENNPSQLNEGEYVYHRAKWLDDL